MKPPLSIVSMLVLLVAVSGCEKHDHGKDGHDHAAPKGKTDGGDAGDHHDGPVVALGSGEAGPFSLTVSRDAGDVKAGGDAAIDVHVAGTSRVKAVRFWIGLENGVGSVKALAAIENPAEPERWHTHAEIPSPIPDEAKLWVEIEDGAGLKHTAGFDLKR